VSLLRDFDPTEIGAAEVTATGTSEVSMRNQYRAWVQYMTATMSASER
jgi:hypothetical protein